MPGKLAKNLKIRAAHRLHTRKVPPSVDELLRDYDGSDTTKDKINRITITLNEKLATLKALDESILAAIDEGNLEPEIEESEEFRARIHGALSSCRNVKILMANKNRLKEVKVGLFLLVLVTVQSYQNYTLKDLLATQKTGKHFGIRSRLRCIRTLR